MSVITVRSLPEDLTAQLQRQAKAHHRSMEAEVRAILAEAMQPILTRQGSRHVNFDLIDKTDLGELLLEPIRPLLDEIEP
jgi:plasmid stability protein